MVRGISDSYTHIAKRVGAGEAARIGDAILKWYDIAPEESPVGDDAAQSARRFVASGDLWRDLDLTDDLGFVILHRCGADFYFLLVSVWRGTNEVWEAVYATDRDDGQFRAFPAAYPAPGRPSRPTFCVWELGVVGHEAKAWTRYLESNRSDGDVSAWRRDVMSGMVS